jgi:hypothetical protein
VSARPHPSLDDTIRLRFLVVRRLPLLVVDVRPGGTGAALIDGLADRGLASLPGFLGVDLPRGARVGFVLDAAVMRLVDDRDETLLRAPRDAIDRDWADAARRLKGTMMVVTDLGDLQPDAPVAQVAHVVDQRARTGEVLGAIVGVTEERPQLPLVF